MNAQHCINEYLAQAEHNTKVAQYIRDKRSDCLDWWATCLFYAAVHYVNAYLRKFGIPIPRRHRGKPTEPGRTNIVQSLPDLCAIFPQYSHLDDESRDARYELKKISAADYDRLLKPKLEEIFNFIVPKVTN